MCYYIFISIDAMSVKTAFTLFTSSLHSFYDQSSKRTDQSLKRTDSTAPKARQQQEKFVFWYWKQDWKQGWKQGWKQKLEEGLDFKNGKTTAL